MRIALDYDKTYSADPAFWNRFIADANASGHEVRIVTARDDRYDRTAPLIKAEGHAPIIWCRGVAKRWHCNHFVPDFVPEVWIDDKPEAVLENSPFPPLDLHEWRYTRDEGPAWDLNGNRWEHPSTALEVAYG